MAYIDCLSPVHTATKRDYLPSMIEHPKAESITIAKHYGEEYWDGPRHLGYGGYKYDDRWRPVAEKPV